MNVATEIVKVPSMMLTKDLRKNILSILCSTKEGTCTKKNGCILRIVELVEIIDALICTADKSNHFKVTYSYISFIPEIGIEYSASVFKSYQDGIIVIVNGYPSIKVLVPPGKYSCGDDVKVVIHELQFVDDSFMGVGDIM